MDRPEPTNLYKVEHYRYDPVELDAVVLKKLKDISKKLGSFEVAEDCLEENYSNKGSAFDWNYTIEYKNQCSGHKKMWVDAFPSIKVPETSDRIDCRDIYFKVKYHYTDAKTGATRKMEMKNPLHYDRKTKTMTAGKFQLNRGTNYKFSIFIDRPKGEVTQGRNNTKPPYLALRHRPTVTTPSRPRRLLSAIHSA
jgi:hypothetical protein